MEGGEIVPPKLIGTAIVFLREKRGAHNGNRLKRKKLNWKGADTHQKERKLKLVTCRLLSEISSA